MQSSQNLPVVEAKQEYTNVLKDAVFDVIHEKFVSMYKECLNEKSKEPILVRYMQKLREVLDWSPAYIEIHLNKIKRNCAWFNELLTAVIVTNVKILSSVKVNKNKKKVQLKMPDCVKFVHQIFINTAKKIYNDIQKSKQFKPDNETFMSLMIHNSIDETIRNQIPIQNILQNMLEEDSEEEPEPEEEPEDEPEEEPEDEPEEPEPEEPEPEEPEPEEPEEPEPEEPEPEEFKEPEGPKNNFEPEVQKTSFFDPPKENIKQIPIQDIESKKKFMFDDAAPDPED